MRRSAGIVNALIEAGADVRVASGTFVDRESFFHPETRFINLPAHRILNRKTGEHFYYSPRGKKIKDPEFDEQAWREDRDSIIHDTLAKEPAHAMLVEFWPFSRRREFSSTVETVLDSNAGLAHRPLIFSSARDILDTSNSQKKSRSKIDSEQHKAADLIRTHVDHVLIHSDPRLVAFEDGFAYWDDIKDKATYTGYVLNDDAVSQPGDKREKMVVVSTGSGSTGVGLIKAAARARPYTTLKDHKWVYILGPRMGKDERVRALSAIAEFGNAARVPVGSTEIFDHRPDLPQLLRRADFAISLAGYNTTLETLASGVPAVLVPKFQERKEKAPWSDSEQKGRLVKLDRRGMLHMAYPSTAIKPKNFAGVINRAVHEGPGRVHLDFNGAAKTAEIVLQKIEERFGISPHTALEPAGHS